MIDRNLEQIIEINMNGEYINMDERRGKRKVLEVTLRIRCNFPHESQSSKRLFFSFPLTVENQKIKVIKF